MPEPADHSLQRAPSFASHLRSRFRIYLILMAGVLLSIPVYLEQHVFRYQPDDLQIFHLVEMYFMILVF